MQSYYKRHGKYCDYVEWMEPIYKWDEVTNLEDVAEHIHSYDIVFFSSYLWNYTMCDEIATIAKQKNPNMISAVGGPLIGLNIPSIFNNRFKYDFICKPMKPGEPFAAKLIDSYFDNNGIPNRNDIPWELNSFATCPQVEFEFSVYEDHMEFLKKLVLYKNQKKLIQGIILETTRGCPYSCVFCEWGGGIGEKVIKKNMDLIKKDILAIAECGFKYFDLADANFGMYKERDLEFLDFALQNGITPQAMSFVKLKNLEKKKQLITDVFNVIKKNVKGKVSTEYGGFFGVGTSHQTVSDEAIKIANRVDLTFNEKTEIGKHIKNLLKDEDPSETIDLVMAMPGSTLDDFYEECNLMWNSKSVIPRYLYLFLPDSPCTKPEYLKKYNINLVKVKGRFINDLDVSKNSIYRKISIPYHTIVSCFSFTKEEMKQMWIMNIVGYEMLNNYYKNYESKISAKNFILTAWGIIQELSEFKEMWDYADRLYSIDSEPLDPNYINGIYFPSYINNLFIKKDKLIKLKLDKIFKEQYAIA